LAILEHHLPRFFVKTWRLQLVLKSHRHRHRSPQAGNESNAPTISVVPPLTSPCSCLWTSRMIAPWELIPWLSLRRSSESI
jgi:hypothetical protein